MSNDSFYEGLWVDYRQHHGYIRFVCEDYVTICINRLPVKDPHALRDTNEVCLLVYKNNWDEIIPEISKHRQ
ncbi:hypothetical protein SWPG_00194 [Synechococcus phage S-CBM2]|nr:hypothetical protein SWPG_00194 [Synechococcus phage S-CBM2]